MLSRLIRYVGTSSVSVSVSVSSSIIIPNNNKLFPPPRPFVSYLIRSFSSITEPLLFNPETLNHGSAFVVFDVMLDFDGFYSISDYNFLFSSLRKKGYLLTIMQLAQRWDESLSRKCYDHVYPNVDTWNILISCHSKSPGNMSSAFSLFNNIIKAGHRPAASTLNDLSQGLCHKGQIYKAIMFYKYTILKGFQLNLHTYLIIISGLCKIGETEKAIHFLREAPQLRKIHKEQKQIQETKLTIHIMSKEETLQYDNEKKYEALYGPIIITLCKERHINEAYDLFSELIVKKNIIPNNFLYCCLVYGYCITGQFKQAIALFREFGEALRIRNIGALDTEHIQDVKAGNLVTEQEVKAAKRAVAVLIAVSNLILLVVNP